jgi:galactokinase/mevalonate kinase-like predicted kinase
VVVRARAPLRLSFAGGGTDVAPFPATEGGAVLSATIDRYAYGSLTPATMPGSRGTRTERPDDLARRLAGS